MEHLNAPSVVSSVKTVDFGPFLDGSDKQGVANAILDSFKSIGFVYLVPGEPWFRQRQDCFYVRIGTIQCVYLLYPIEVP